MSSFDAARHLVLPFGFAGITPGDDQEEHDVNMNDELMTKSELAQAILERLLAKRDRISIDDAWEAAEDAGISRRTMQRAKDAMGLKEIHNGPFGGFWEKS